MSTIQHSGSPYALGLCNIFYVHCSLVLFASEAHGICEFCLANSASQDSRVSFVQDSIWIYLFFMVTWTYFTLFVGEISNLRGTLYCGSNTRWRTSSFFGSLGFFLLLGFCSIATYYFDTGCQFSFNLGLWIGEILAVTLVNCVLGIQFSLKFTLALVFYLALLIGLSFGIPGFPESDLGGFW